MTAPIFVNEPPEEVFRWQSPHNTAIFSSQFHGFDKRVQAMQQRAQRGDISALKGSAFDALVQQLDRGVLVFDEKLQPAMCNPAAASILGRTIEQVLTGDLPDWSGAIRWTEDEVEPISDHGDVLREALAHGQEHDAIIERDTGETYRLEVRPLNDGVMMTLEPLRDGLNDPHFRQLFEHHTMPMLLLEPDTRKIVDANPAAQSFYERERDELIGQRMTECEHAPHHGSVGTRYTLSNGDTRMVEIFSSPLDFGDTESLFTVLNDVTEREDLFRQLHSYNEQLERANHDLQEFTSVASHDLQEPLRKVIAFSDRLQSRYADQLEDRAADYLDRIQNAAHRMRSLIEALLELSRVSTDQHGREEVDLEELVDDLVDMFDVRIAQTDATIDITRPLGKVWVDPIQLRQLLQNLISNALKFHKDETPPTIHISTGEAKPDEDGAPMCMLCVRDEGIGMKQEYADAIFEPFKRLHGRSSCYEGSGIGLAICRKIIERHSGHIEVDTAPGEGTEFRVYLPTQPPLQDEASVSGEIEII